MSVPIGRPYDSLETFTSNFSNIFCKYWDVISPSIEGFNAIIISFTLVFILLFIKFYIFMSSGFFPSIC